MSPSKDGAFMGQGGVVVPKNRTTSLFLYIFIHKMDIYYYISINYVFSPSKIKILYFGPLEKVFKLCHCFKTSS